MDFLHTRGSPSRTPAEGSVVDQKARRSVDDWAVVDVFCGVGGLSHGFARAGFHVAAGIDVDETCRFAFEANNGGQFVGRSIDAVSAGDLAGLYPPGARRILVGCAPCQPFSAYTPEAKKRRTGKWGLIEAFQDRVMALQPEVVSMENVPRLASFDDGRVLNRFIDCLEGAYTVTKQLVDCQAYGVPQRRKRLVVLASKLGRLSLMSPTRKNDPTVRGAIGRLPPVSHGATDPGDRMHSACKLSALNLKRIRASTPGGSWQEWPDDLRAACHRRASGKWYRNVYGRMAWDEPAPTITTGCFGFGRGRFGHPVQDRAITLREAALLQTFPPEYAFVAPEDPVHFASVGRHVGNAVPVALAEAIAHSIRKHIESER